MDVGWFRAMYGKMGLMRAGVQLLLWSIVITVLLIIVPRVAPGIIAALLAILMPIILLSLLFSVFLGGGGMGLKARYPGFVAWGSA